MAFEVWSTVDATARPDLVALASAVVLNRPICDRCNSIGPPVAATRFLGEGFDVILDPARTDRATGTVADAEDGGDSESAATGQAPTVVGHVQFEQMAEQHLGVGEIERAIAAAKTHRRLNDSGAELAAAGTVALRLWDRWLREGDEASLVQGYEFVQRAVELAVEREDEDSLAVFSPILAEYRDALAGGGDAEDFLLSQIAAHRTALADAADPVTEAASRRQLHRALRDRWTRFGHEESLREAIDHRRVLLAESSPGEREWFVHASDLSAALLDESRLSGALEPLEEAIELLRSVVTEADLERLHWLPTTNLSVALCEYGARLGRDTWIDEAVELAREAATKSSDERANLNLAKCIFDRFYLRGRLVDLDEVIDLAGHSRGSLQFDGGLATQFGLVLSDAHLERWRLEGEEHDLDAARRTAEALARRDSSVWVLDCQIRVELADQEHRQSADGESRIVALRDRFVLQVESDPRAEPHMLRNAGLWLLELTVARSAEEGLDRAVRLFEAAVERCELAVDMPQLQASLAHAVQRRWARFGRPDDVAEAVRWYRSSAELGATLTPSQVLRSAFDWGRWAAERESWAEAAEAFEHAAAAARRLHKAQVLEADSHAWLGLVQDIPGNLAVALTMTGQAEEAILALERTRALCLVDALERERATVGELEHAHPDHALRYRAAASSVNRLTGALPRSSLGHARPLESDIDRAYEELEQATEAIRALPRFADFLRSDSGLAPTVTEHRALVALAVGTTRSVALVVHTTATGAVRTTPLEIDVDSGSLEELLLPDPRGRWPGWAATLTTGTVSEMKQALPTLLDQLWHLVMAPVVEQLAPTKTREVILLATGALALMPLHAAGTRSQRAVVDRFLVMASPSSHASAIAARNLPSAADRPGVVTIGAAPGTADQIPNASLEGRAVAALLDDAIGPSEAPSVSDVLEAIDTCGVAHFACHGLVDELDPAASGLMLSGSDVLSIRDLGGAESRPRRLAVLSACNTGVIGLRAPDEAVALPSAFIRAGFCGVIASLWPVEDSATALLMSAFYSGWLREGLHPANALRSAQWWLRSARADELGPVEASLRAGAPEVPELPDHPPSLDSRAPFGHPFYWAAFYYSGA